MPEAYQTFPAVAIPTLSKPLDKALTNGPAAPAIGLNAMAELKKQVLDVAPRENGQPLSDLDVVVRCKASQEAGFKPKAVFRNLSPAELYEMALKYEPGSMLTEQGALAATSGAKTGRTPKDKRVVRDPEVEADVWWGQGSPNHEMDDRSFLVNREAAVSFLNSLDRVYVFDGFANWDPASRMKIRVVTSRAYHTLFMHNMLIRPSREELRSFGEPAFVIYNAGESAANQQLPYMTSSTSVNISLKRLQMVILGTQYAGEMKKGVFSVMHYLMPKAGVLSLHSGCNVGADNDVTLFFGLSGTGKTTLSTDPRRPLIGDDEHCWGDNGVFNIEGGCYAKCIGLRPESEPEIYQAIRFGSVLENVDIDPVTRKVDYSSSRLTENTRASYPINYIPNARLPCVGPHPRNIILLCCDAFGVLPPVSKLTAEQAMYHFISGYTSKVAGTEEGVREPEATFSACYGGAFLMWHPTKYAAMLAEKMAQHGTQAWLINTGWTGGQYGVGSRISLRYTRAIVDAIHSGALLQEPTHPTAIFGLAVPAKCPGVPAKVLDPSQQWANRADFDATLRHLADLFLDNFAQYTDGGAYVGADMVSRILAGGPATGPVTPRQDGSA
jgi:phosphoenolpyruvate carboxykinase (ATP)